MITVRLYNRDEDGLDKHALTLEESAEKDGCVVVCFDNLIVEVNARELAAAARFMEENV